MIILVVVTFLFLRARHFKHKIVAVVVILIILFFYVSASNIIKTQGIDLKTFEGVVQLTKLYGAWLWNMGLNIKELTGNVLKLDWKPKINETLK